MVFAFTFFGFVFVFRFWVICFYLFLVFGCWFSVLVFLVVITYIRNSMMAIVAVISALMMPV